MATLVFSIAGQAVGGAIAGPIGATIGRALGALAGSAVDQAIFGEPASDNRPQDIRVIGSSEGGSIPRVYGWARLSGNLIWATEPRLVSVAETGGKGFGQEDEDQLVASFAIALAEGEVHHLGRVWADNRLLETEGLNISFYRGTETQVPNAEIIAAQGAADTPAYRGTSYIVFEGLPLAQFGNRIPNISVEVCRVVGELEPQMKAVTLIPGSTEFGYDPVPRVRLVSPGVTANENANMLAQTSDWSLSIDQLLDLCPNLEHVALVVAWFGDDLRCDHCKIEPRTESATKTVQGATWSVSGIVRAQSKHISLHQGAPAFGGTPSDASVLAAIADLTQRGLKVTLYPFVMMDVSQDNVLPDPWSDNLSQPAYPWRGRITCNPAPGRQGSPDKSAAARSQVDAFVGLAAANEFQISGNGVSYFGPNEWSYRRFILHYAHLSAAAGGVDAFLIGSELKGLTTVRENADAAPFVSALRDLVADVRSILGPTTKLTYGADWSEYHGLQPVDAPGDKLFLLDPLWADPNIDAVGIDNYLPLSDWRGTGEGGDEPGIASIYDLDYLRGNVAGGEFFDYYYATDEDRRTGTRTPITDGMHGEHWIWRQKDLRSWWQSAHHNRVNGVRSTVPTAYIPQSKPIWFTELGCGAVDKGANQPNTFADPKSAESAAPYFSDGSPDALIQRQFLRAHFAHWNPGHALYVAGNNPVSAVYGDTMLDTSRLYLWTWDARPYPAFPTRSEIWADGSNHVTGHWLTGRLGGIASDEWLNAVAKDWTVPLGELATRGALISGQIVSNPTTLRQAIEPGLDLLGLGLKQAVDNLVAIDRSGTAPVTTAIASEMLVADGSLLTRKTRPAGDEEVGALSLSYADRAEDYLNSSATAYLSAGLKGAVSTAFTLDAPSASRLVGQKLRRARQVDTIRFGLPLSHVGLEPGDCVTLGENSDISHQILEIRQTDHLTIDAAEIESQPPLTITSALRARGRMGAAGAAAPYLLAVPHARGGAIPEAMSLGFGGFASPWPGDISIAHALTDETVATLQRNGTLGHVTATEGNATAAMWNMSGHIDLVLLGGHLSSETPERVREGLNRLWLQHDDGSWELLGFTRAEMLGGLAYRISGLLRGLDGTDWTLSRPLSPGAPVISPQAWVAHDIANSQVGSTISFTLGSHSAPLVDPSLDVSISSDAVVPLAPAHLNVRRAANGDALLTWVRRSRAEDLWDQLELDLGTGSEAYLLAILDGQTIVREEALGVSNYVYTAAQQVSDLGAAGAAFGVRVQQISTRWGAGHSTQL